MPPTRTQGLRFRSKKFPLRCVRPFVMRDVALESDSGIDKDAADVGQQIGDFLSRQVCVGGERGYPWV